VAGSDLYLDSPASYRVAQQAAGMERIAVNEQTLRRRLHGRDGVGLMPCMWIAGSDSKERPTIPTHSTHWDRWPGTASVVASRPCCLRIAGTVGVVGKPALRPSTIGDSHILLFR
jgi:hypothetical protein